MDRQSHYKWELTEDELNTIWYALIERKDRLNAQAESSKDPEIKELKVSLARECGALQQQINRMRSRWY